MMCYGFIFFMHCQVPTPVPLEDYCKLATKIIQQKGDSNIQAPLGVKKRIVINDQVFNRLCGGK